MPDDAARWTEDDSRAFLEIVDIAVPARVEQIDAFCRLIPAEPDEPFTAVEMGAGGGHLARAVLARFPRCRYLALDGSRVMRDTLRAALAPFGDRVAIDHFDLAGRAWRDALPRPLRCVLSSLVVHHLPAGGKRALFRDLAARLEPGGALLLADLLEPATPRVRRYFADQWDALALEQGPEPLYRLFVERRWNFYSDPEPDPADHPSRLVDQLDWLREAGFAAVDCFWMRAGHAIYGGYR